jgi:hypothetical protein
MLMFGLMRPYFPHPNPCLPTTANFLVSPPGLQASSSLRSPPLLTFVSIFLALILGTDGRILSLDHRKQFKPLKLYSYCQYSISFLYERRVNIPHTTSQNWSTQPKNGRFSMETELLNAQLTGKLGSPPNRRNGAPLYLSLLPAFFIILSIPVSSFPHHLSSPILLP